MNAVRTEIRNLQEDAIDLTRCVRCTYPAEVELRVRYPEIGMWRAMCLICAMAQVGRIMRKLPEVKINE